MASFDLRSTLNFMQGYPNATLILYLAEHMKYVIA